MGNLGDKLRDARQRQQLSLDDVEAATKIRKTYLIALEQEDYSRFPALIYAKGFLRSYAAFLGLDAAALANLIPEPESPAHLEPPTHMPKSPRAIGSWLVVGFIITMVGAVGVYLYEQGLSTPYEPEPIADVAIELPTATPSPTVVPSPTPKEYSDTVEVQVKAVERTWVAVNVDSLPVFTGTLEIGDNFVWTGQEKIQMRIGNAGGLDISLNGQRQGMLGKPGEVIDAELTSTGHRILTPTPASG